MVIQKLCKKTKKEIHSTVAANYKGVKTPRLLNQGQTLNSWDEIPDANKD